MFVVSLIVTGKHSSAVIRNNPPTDVVTRVFIAFHHGAQLSLHLKKESP